MAEHMVDKQLGRHHGADRAGRRLGRRRRPDQGHAAARRHLAHRGRQAVHHLRRARLRPTTSSTSCWPAPRAPARAPRACRCSSCPSSTSTSETGELGERNGAFVTNVEHKMGLKVSTTCELRFGERRQPAVGTLLGDVHDGIAQMFQVIEYARMMVGTKAIATLSTGYLNALDYAKQRVQGADLTQMTDKTAPRVTITHHPDVRRSLMTAEGVRRGPARAGALHRDAAGRRRRLAPRPRGVDGRAAASPTRVNDLLLPLVKGCGSERAWVLLGTESLQTSAARASCRTTRSSSTCATPRSTPSTRARPRSRAWTSSSARSSRDKGQALGAPGHADPGVRQGRGDGDGALVAERELLGRALEDVQGIVGDDGRLR